MDDGSPGPRESALAALLSTLPLDSNEEREISAQLASFLDLSPSELSAKFHALPLVLARETGLLLHASTCLLRGAKDAPCSVFPAHCASFQSLFFHMQSCAKTRRREANGGGEEDCPRCGVLRAHLAHRKQCGACAQCLPIPTITTAAAAATASSDLLLPLHILENAQMIKRLRLANTSLLEPDAADQVTKLLFEKEQLGYLLQSEFLRQCQGNKVKFNELLTVCFEQNKPKPAPAPPPPPPPPPSQQQQQLLSAPISKTVASTTAPLVVKPPAASRTKPSKTAPVASAAPVSNATPRAKPPSLLTAPTITTTTTTPTVATAGAAASAKRSLKKADTSASKRASAAALADKRKFPAPNWERRNQPFPVLTEVHLQNSFLNHLPHAGIVQHVASLARYQHRKEGTGQTHAHSRNFDPTKNFRQVANNLLRMLMDLPYAHVFRHPVDPVALGLEGYFEIVKHPMDLGTIKQKLESKATGASYTKLADFVHDVRLMFNNAILYNTLEQDVGQIAAEYAALFEQTYLRICLEEEDKFAESRYLPNACNMCAHVEDFYFEPPVYVCDVCEAKIKRDSLMYVNTSADHRICRACFKDQPGSFVRFNSSSGSGAGGEKEKFSKSLFKEQKNNQVVREEWVICFWCRRKSHAICSMARTGATPGSGALQDFICPTCMLRNLEARSFQQTDFNKFPVHINLEDDTPVVKRTAAQLPRTALSDFIEEGLARRIVQEEEQQDGEPLRRPGKLSVRVVLSKQEDLFTREGMLELYADNPNYGYPKSFPAKQKCLLLFEEIDGFDVLLFVMYVQYFGSDAPKPNRRSLYISYLDSVNFFSVSALRTVVYQEILISLLAFEKRNGYVRCFIWACPPANGDDYIFYVHPKTQRIPDTVKLRNWYFHLLEEARQRGIVVSLNTLFDEYICRVPDVRFVPYFDGDWVNVYGEFFIKNLKKKEINPLRRQSAAEASKNTGTLLKLTEQELSMQRQVSKQQQQPRKSAAEPLESGHETCAAIRPLLSVPVQDVLMAKMLAENEKMRKDFIVVKMCEECADCGKQMDEPNVLHWISPQYDARRDPHDYRFRTYAAPYCLCHECYCKFYEWEYGEPVMFELPPLLQLSPMDDKQQSSSLDVEFKFPQQQQQHAALGSSPTQTPLGTSSPPPPPPQPTPGIVTRRKRNHGEAEDLYDAHRHSTTGVEVLPLGVTACPPNAYATGQYAIDLKSMRLVRANVPDTASQQEEAIESPLFDKRRGFLSKCQDRKWQFDELRRAKHSTQCILELLHRPEAEEYVIICSNCQVELKQEYYSCNASCEDFDLCAKCHATVKHEHAMVLIRPMELKSALAIMEHIKTCGTAKRGSDACEYCGKMVRLFAHFEKCALKEAGGCGGCKRFMYLLSTHVKQCRDAQCTLPHCARLKQQYRRQQEGDNDRRVMSLGREATIPLAASVAAAAGSASASSPTQQQEQ